MRRPLKVTHRLVGSVRWRGQTFGPGDEREFFSAAIDRKDMDRLLANPAVCEPLEKPEEQQEEEEGTDDTSNLVAEELGERMAIEGINKSKDVMALRILRREHKSPNVVAAIDARISKLTGAKS